MSDYLKASIKNESDKNYEYFSSFDECKKKPEPNQELILNTFKDMIELNPNIVLIDKSICTDDNFLYRFLYITKFNCSKAMDLLTDYLIYKKKSQIWQNINIFDEKIQQAISDGNPGLLRERDRKGRKVITFTAANWNIEKYSLKDIFRALLLTLDKLLENIENQALGFVVIVDWTSFTLKQSAHLSLTTLNRIIEGLQSYMPVKFKGIHFVGQPWYVELAFATIKSLFSEKIKRRFYLHGTNLNTLHNIVSKDILPPELGGEASSINHLDWFHFLVASSQYSEMPKDYRIIKILKYTKTPI